MKKHFFIYSLPRSGSAWLSMFLSQPGAYCFHEPLADDEPLMERLARRPEDVVGAIDTSAYTDPITFPPEVPVYVLWRNWNEIQDSSLRMGYDVDIQFEQRILTRNVTMTASNTIRYRDLDNLDYLEVLWKELVGTSFDRERAEFLIEMKVERSEAAIVKRLKTWRNNI